MFKKYMLQKRNICPSLLRKSKASDFQNLDSKVSSDNKKLWKSLSSLFSGKVKSKGKVF